MVKNIRDFSPVVGVFVDPKLNEKLAKFNLDIHEYFKMILEKDANKVPNWRYTNLNKNSADFSEKENFQKFRNSIISYLQQTSSLFINQSFVNDFAVNTKNPNDTVRFPFESIEEETFWFSDYFALISKYHKEKQSIFSDIPRYIISFVEKPTDNVFPYFSQKCKKELEENLANIHKQYIVQIDGENIKLTSSDSGTSFIFKIDPNVKSQLFDYDIEERYNIITQKTKESVVFSIELYKELRNILVIILDKQVPTLLNTLIPQNNRDKVLIQKKASKLFSLRQNPLEEYMDILLRIALDYAIIGDLDASSSTVDELMQFKGSANYIRIKEVKVLRLFLLIHSDKTDYDAIFDAFIDLIPSLDNIVLLYLIMYITKIEVDKNEPNFTPQQEEFLRNIYEFNYGKGFTFIHQTIALCYERISGACLRCDRTGHAALMMVFARKHFSIKDISGQVPSFNGHTLRCAAFVQHYITMLDDHTKVFSCGERNANILKNSPVVAHAKWEMLNSRSLKTVAKYLNKCDLVSQLASIYYYLYSHCYSQKFAEKVLQGILNSANKTNIETFPYIRLPYFTVQQNARIIQYGTPEYFGYQKEAYEKFNQLWDRETNEIKNVKSKWGVSDIDNDYINPFYLPCNEPSILRLEIFREAVPFPLQMTHIHAAAEEVPSHINYIEPVAFSSSFLPFNLHNNIKDYEKNSFERRKTDMKIDLPNSDVVQTDFCNEYTMDTIIAPQKDGKPQKSTLQLTFVPKEKKFVINSFDFTFWKISEVNIRSPPFFIQGITKQPSISVQINGLPKQTAQGEVTKFTIRVANIGDAPLPRLFCLHDAPFALHIVEDNIISYPQKESDESTVISVEPIIIDPEKAIQPGEEIELTCYFMGQQTTTYVRMMWFFEGNQPLKWRKYANEFVVYSNVHEIIQIKPFYDPRDTRNLILTTSFMPTDEDLNICSASFLNRRLTKFNSSKDKNRESNTHDGNLFTRNWSNFIFTQENGTGNTDSNDEKEGYEKWRQSFINKNKQYGYVICKSKQTHDHNPNKQTEKSNQTQDNDEIHVKQHPITIVENFLLDFMFKIECETNISLDENKFKVVPVTLFICNNTEEDASHVNIIARNRVDNSKQILFWQGKTKYSNQCLKKKSQESFSFELLIKNAGHYNISSFIIEFSNGQIMKIPFEFYIVAF